MNSLTHAAPIALAERRASLLATLARTLRMWIARDRERRALRQLDDRLLDDIGVTRAQANAVADKPFWRG